MTPKPTDVALFVTVGLLVIDITLTTLWLSPGRLRIEAAQLLDGWDLLKAGLAGAILLIVAIRRRSPVPVVFGLIVLAIGFQDETGWHAPLAAMIVERFAMDATTAGVSTVAIVEATLLTTLAILFVIVVWGFTPSDAAVSEMRRTLLLLLGLMFIFAVLIDLLNDSISNTIVMRTEEVGERIALTLIVGYAAGRAAH